MLHAARADPRRLTIGVDANAASMATAARRAQRPRTRLPNAMFVVAAAEALPAELTGVADLVTVYFPWASLLRGLVTADGPVLSYVAALCRPGGTFEAMWSLVDRDRSVADIAQDDAIAARFAGAGLRVLELRAPTQAEIDATCSTWAKRLRAGVDRPVTMVRSVRV